VTVSATPGKSALEFPQEPVADPGALGFVSLGGQAAYEGDVVTLPGDHGVDDAGGLLGQAVRRTAPFQPPAPVRRGRVGEPPQALRVVAEGSDVLQRLGDIVQGGAGAGEVPVDDAHRPSALPEDVPRAEVAVADHLPRQGEGGRGVVVLAQQACEGVQSLVADDLAQPCGPDSPSM
jgi:hypothetical protein